MNGKEAGDHIRKRQLFFLSFLVAFLIVLFSYAAELASSSNI